MAFQFDALQWYSWVMIFGLICSLLMCIGLFMVVVAMNSRSRPTDNTKSEEYHKHSMKCPCGCDRVQDMKCSACNQIATGCTECHRRLTPCDCGEEARTRHRRLSPLPSAAPLRSRPGHPRNDWVRCSCGSQEVRKMTCADCRQSAMGCIDCKQRLSRCVCDETETEEPSQICYGKERKVRHRSSENVTIDIISPGKDTVDTDVVKKVLTKFLRKPAESKSHDACRSERISSLEQQLAALKKTNPLNCDGEDKQIRSLERQLQAMIKQNAELTESLRQCAQNRFMDKMGEINQIPNNNLIPNNNPILNSNPMPNCNQQSRLPLRQQLDQIQMALSLSDIVDLHRETQQGRSYGERDFKGEFVKTVQDVRDEIKEVKQLEKIRESERAPRYRRERKYDPEPKYRRESRYRVDERHSGDEGYSQDEKYSREPKGGRQNRRICRELDEVSISDIESEDDYYHDRYR